MKILWISLLLCSLCAAQDAKQSPNKAQSTSTQEQQLAKRVEVNTNPKVQKGPFCWAGKDENGHEKFIPCLSEEAKFLAKMDSADSSSAAKR